MATEQSPWWMEEPAQGTERARTAAALERIAEALEENLDSPPPRVWRAARVAPPCACRYQRSGTIQAPGMSLCNKCLRRVSKVAVGETAPGWMCPHCCGALWEDYAPPNDPGATCGCCDRYPTDAERLVAAVAQLRGAILVARPTPAGSVPNAMKAAIEAPVRSVPTPEPASLPRGGQLVRLPSAVSSPGSENLVDVHKAAEMVGMSRHFIYRASADGRLPCRRIGSRLRFVPGELKSWAEAQG